MRIQPFARATRVTSPVDWKWVQDALERKLTHAATAASHQVSVPTVCK
jgi:hypothetical protein